MKKFFICLLVLIYAKIIAQEKVTIQFEYDQSGNFIERKVQAISLGRFSKFDLNIDSVSKPNLFTVSPNPTSTFLDIKMEHQIFEMSTSIELITLNGQLVQKIPDSQAINRTIDVSNLKSGLYFLVINYSNREREIHKIIIND